MIPFLLHPHQLLGLFALDDGWRIGGLSWLTLLTKLAACHGRVAHLGEAGAIQQDFLKQTNKADIIALTQNVDTLSIASKEGPQGLGMGFKGEIFFFRELTKDSGNPCQTAPKLSRPKVGLSGGF